MDINDHDVLIGLVSDVSWLKWAVFMIYPIILAHLGVTVLKKD